MVQLNIGGVPEHFNMPWQLLMDSGKLKDKGIQANWTDFPGGTGALVEALNLGKLDIGILLTEGALKGISNGGTFRIVSFYINAPLVWGIHVPGHSSYKTMEDVKGKTYAISRYGSGSHLMSFIDAQSRGWQTENMHFELVGNLEGARQAFQEGKADIFLWEKFMTKPYVDNGEFRRIAETPTPYDCFVVCVTEEALAKKEESVFKTLKQAFKMGKKLYRRSGRTTLIAKKYGLKEKDVAIWLGTVKWAEKINRQKKMLKSAMKTLKKLDLIDQKLSYKQVIFKRQKPSEPDPPRA